MRALLCLAGIQYELRLSVPLTGLFIMGVPVNVVSTCPRELVNRRDALFHGRRYSMRWLPSRCGEYQNDHSTNNNLIFWWPNCGLVRTVVGCQCICTGVHWLDCRIEESY